MRTMHDQWPVVFQSTRHVETGSMILLATNTCHTVDGDLI